MSGEFFFGMFDISTGAFFSRGRFMYNFPPILERNLDSAMQLPLQCVYVRVCGVLKFADWAPNIC